MKPQGSDEPRLVNMLSAAEAVAANLKPQTPALCLPAQGACSASYARSRRETPGAANLKPQTPALCLPA